MIIGMSGLAYLSSVDWKILFMGWMVASGGVVIGNAEKLEEGW